MDVKDARNRLDMSQAELAAIVGVSTRTIQNWESGATVPTPRQVEIITRVLNAVVPSNTSTTSRLISIIESQQRVIETLTREHST